MNQIKCFIGVLCFLVFCNFVFAQMEQFGPDDYGKIIGKFIDPDSGLPIAEVFSVILLETNPNDPTHPVNYRIETDKNGCFSLEVVARSYYIQFAPTTYETPYACEPSIKYGSPITTKVVTVERCKVTRVMMKPRYGGRIHFKLVDQDGQLLNVQEVLSTKNLFLEVNCEGGSTCLGISRPGNSMSDGEYFSSGRLPGKYSARFSASAGGVGPLSIFDIEVKIGETTIVPIVLDLNSGITGTVLYKDSTPQNSLWIHATHNSSLYTADVFSKKDGGFKFINLKEGSYKIEYITVIDGKETSGELKNVIVKKGSLTPITINLK